MDNLWITTHRVMAMQEACPPPLPPYVVSYRGGSCTQNQEVMIKIG